MQPSCQLLTRHSPLPLRTASISLSLWLRLRLAYSSCTMAGQEPCTATPDDPAPAHLLAPCLLVLFNAAFSTGQVPKSWKTSLVTPVFKHGDATDTANYRPISVGEPISRLYASIMVQRLVKYTEQQQLRSPTQTGYRPSILPSLFSMSLTNTGMLGNLCTYALWT